MYIVNLVRKRSYEYELWVSAFQAEDIVTNPEQALRDAVKEFLSTEEGRKALDYTAHDFNWGDAVTHVPEEIWNRYGLKFQNVKSVDIKVNQDEVLCGEIEDGE